ncbi:MAG: universal stress protein [Bradymonadia bacterium]
MLSIKRILVPIDFSACSQHALDYALTFAERFEARVDLLHVYEPPFDLGDVPVQVGDAPPLPISEYIRVQVRNNLEVMLDQCPEHIQVTSHLITGRVDHEVVELAERESIDLIIMGTHGRTGLSRFFLGSVAERVLRRANCPVLTVRHPEEDADIEAEPRENG